MEYSAVQYSVVHYKYNSLLALTIILFNLLQQDLILISI